MTSSFLARSSLVLTAFLSASAAACGAPVDSDDEPAGAEAEVRSGPEAAASGVRGSGAILAIGDSVTFGWDPVLESDWSKIDEKNYAGYPELLGERTRSQVHNAACPGEATGSFFSKTAPDNGCRGNRAAFGTHYPWKEGDRSLSTQMELVESYLAKNKPRFITLTLGGNDLGILANDCKSNPICVATRLLGVINAVGDNLTEIFKRIDRTGYKGKIAILTQYAPHYGELQYKVGLGGLALKVRDFVKDERVRHPDLGVVVADAFGAFEAVAAEHGGDTCKTGLLIKNRDGKTCDIHPSPKGDVLLADTVEAALR